MLIDFCHVLRNKFETPEGQIDWDKAFNTLDTHGNKVLSKAEFMNGLNHLGEFSMETKIRIRKLIDWDRSELISRDEWSTLKYHYNILCTAEGQQLRKAKHKRLKKEETFEDKDLELVHNFVQHLKKSFHQDCQGNVDFNDIFRSIDDNHNALVSAMEFKQFLVKIGWMANHKVGDNISHVEKSRISDFRRLFQFLDKDKTGLISLHDFSLLEYYMDCREKLPEKRAERERIEAERQRIQKEEEEALLEKRRNDRLDMARIKQQAQEMANGMGRPRSFSQEMIAFGDEGWIEFDKLGPQLKVGEDGPKFIVAVDGSDPSVTALHLCIDFWMSRHRPSQMSVVHIDDPSRKRVPRFRAEFVEAQCESWLVSSLPRHRWATRVMCKELSSEPTRRPLTREIWKQEGQFLLAGIKGSKGPDSSKPMGSTAIHLLSHVEIPVMLVKEDSQIPKAGEPCHHVVSVNNDQGSLKAFIDCIRLAGPEDTVEVVHATAKTAPTENKTLQVLQHKYDFMFNSLVSNQEDKDPNSLPRLLQRGGPWPACSFTVLKLLPEGHTATLCQHLTKVGAHFAYLGLGHDVPEKSDSPRKGSVHYDLGVTYDFIEKMPCTTLVSHFSKPGHIDNLHERHYKSSSPTDRLRRKQSTVGKL